MRNRDVLFGPQTVPDLRAKQHLAFLPGGQKRENCFEILN